MPSAAYEPAPGSSPTLGANPTPVELAVAALGGAYDHNSTPLLGKLLASARANLREEGAKNHPATSPPPAPVAMGGGMNNRAAERLANAGVSLTDFKAMSQADQQTLLQQLAQEEQQAMVQGFDAAKLGFDATKL